MFSYLQKELNCVFYDLASHDCNAYTHRYMVTQTAVRILPNPYSPPSFTQFILFLLYNNFWRFPNSCFLLVGQSNNGKGQEGAAMLCLVAAGVEEYNMRKKKERFFFLLKNERNRRKVEQMREEDPRYKKVTITTKLCYFKKKSRKRERQKKVLSTQKRKELVFSILQVMG